ncbi:hypothetical protein AALD01_04655 [Oscillospiraceae bacterium 21-37]
MSNAQVNLNIIAVDFDGTLCANKYPDIGEANEQVIAYIQSMKAFGYRIILWTCRSGDLLQNAVKWCEHQGIVLDAVNENPPDIIEYFGGDTRKIYASEYIDDKSCTLFKF